MQTLEPSPYTEFLFAGINLSTTIINFIILSALLMLSAFASSSESAYFSLGPKEKESLKNDDSKGAKTALKLLEKPKNLLATLLILNNFVNVGIVILSSFLLDEFYPLNPANQTYRFLIEVVAITFMLLLIGEVIPKIYANKNAEILVRRFSLPIYSVQAFPPIKLLTNLLVSGTRLMQKLAKNRGVKITTDELEHALALTKEDNSSEGEHKILEGIVKFGNTEACQIMKPRMDVFAIETNLPFDQVLKTILEAGYSRIPVYSDSFDNIKGILYIKDLLPHINETAEFKWYELLRKPFFVPENKKIDDLLNEFQTMKMHMAIVVDEYGGSSGVVTLEDILEEIVGDITDEFDDDEIVYSKIDDQTYLFEGKTTLVDFYKVVDIDGKEFELQKGDAETLGGFIIEKAGKILMNNEFIIVENCKFIVESSDKRRIKMIKVVLQN
ncbi:MAG: gliding motility-associated protein GldE [Crocinitomicaceae bacterium]|nr:gliding motility-associated protein GldE [Crocinitomicaceae bacterium]